MKKAFDRITNSIIGLSILTLIIGFILIIFPTVTLETLGIVSGIYLIAHGIVLLMLEMKLIKIFVPFENVIIGFFSILLGFILLSKPESISFLLATILGIWMIVTSINSIKVALFFKNVKAFPWLYVLIIGILDIMLGFLVIFNPFEAVTTLTVYLGIILIIHSILNILDMIILKKNVKEKEQHIKEMFQKFIPKI